MWGPWRHTFFYSSFILSLVAHCTCSSCYPMDKLIHSRDSYQILDYYPGSYMCPKYNVKQCRSGAYYSSLVFQAINKNRLIRT